MMRLLVTIWRVRFVIDRKRPGVNVTLSFPLVLIRGVRFVSTTVSTVDYWVAVTVCIDSGDAP